MSFPSGDSGLSMQLTTFGFREPLNCRQYVKFVSPDDSVLDIGSNVGFFVLLASRAQRITCVEPLGNLIEILKENIRRNGLTEKCEVLQKAVGPKGKLHLEVNPHLNLSKIVGEESASTIEVESVPLAELVREYQPNLVRMDVEGYEYEILHDHIPKPIDKISIELHSGLLGPEKTYKLMSHFRDEGFVLKYFIEDLPLRLYPFLSIIRAPALFKFVSYVREDLSFEEARSLVSTGRSLKYLYLKREAAL